MTTVDALTILALFTGPVIAVQVSMYLERRRKQYDAKIEIFKNLMATRAAKLSPVHVQALNMIDLEFREGDKKTKAVVTAWHEYLDHLNQPVAQENWVSRRDELMTELLYTMSRTLGYSFDRVALKRSLYAPIGHANTEEEDLQMRRGLLEILTGKRGLPIQAVSQESGVGLEEKQPKINIKALRP